MSKAKTIYQCQQCATQFPQWAGRCGNCGAWNSLVEETVRLAVKGKSTRLAGYAGEIQSAVTLIADVPLAEIVRVSTTLSELDRVLGGGLVPGSVILIGGDPGIGKSTLLLQTLSMLSRQHPVLYVTGEESLQQISLRAQRLNLPADQLALLTETQIETILVQLSKTKPDVVVIDSIQTVYTADVPSAPGSVAQLRESTAHLVQYAKRTGTTLFLVGHVTKEGALAGPRVLEHMVDAVLYFEGEQGSRFRLLRAIKNRFGAVNELGIFAMTEKGLREVSNPSAIFLNHHAQRLPGSVVMVTWEGSRPLLVEVQALVDASHLGTPRRVTVGLEQNRLAMLLAVLHRHGQVATYDQDVFLNVVGGVRVMETAADLALLFAVLSSLRNRVVPADLIIFGEVGLAGEIRPVPHGLERIKEAAKHGFRQALIPQGNAPKNEISGIEIIAVENLAQALTAII